jgi:hypothetical protein
VLVTVLGTVLALFTSTLLFLYLFIRLPKVQTPWREIVKGAVLAAVLFEVLKRVGAIYIERTTDNPLYGAFAVVVGLLVWINLVSRMLLFCAAWTVTGPYDSDTAPSGTSSPEQARKAGSRGVRRRPPRRAAGGAEGRRALAAAGALQGTTPPQDVPGGPRRQRAARRRPRRRAPRPARPSGASDGRSSDLTRRRPRAGRARAAAAGDAAPCRGGGTPAAPGGAAPVGAGRGVGSYASRPWSASSAAEPAAQRTADDARSTAAGRDRRAAAPGAQAPGVGELPDHERAEQHGCAAGDDAPPAHVRRAQRGPGHGQAQPQREQPPTPSPSSTSPASAGPCPVLVACAASPASVTARLMPSRRAGSWRRTSSPVPTRATSMAPKNSVMAVTAADLPRPTTSRR